MNRMVEYLEAAGGWSSSLLISLRLTAHVKSRDATNRYARRHQLKNYKNGASSSILGV
jgi:hypothetical protein